MKIQLSIPVGYSGGMIVRNRFKFFIPDYKIMTFTENEFTENEFTENEFIENEFTENEFTENLLFLNYTTP